MLSDNLAKSIPVILQNSFLLFLAPLTVKTSKLHSRCTTTFIIITKWCFMGTNNVAVCQYKLQNMANAIFFSRLNVIGSGEKTSLPCTLAPLLWISEVDVDPLYMNSVLGQGCCDLVHYKYNWLNFKWLLAWQLCPIPISPYSLKPWALTNFADITSWVCN